MTRNVAAYVVRDSGLGTQLNAGPSVFGQSKTSIKKPSGDPKLSGATTEVPRESSRADLYTSHLAFHSLPGLPLCVSFNASTLFYTSTSPIANTSGGFEQAGPTTLRRCDQHGS